MNRSSLYLLIAYTLHLVNAMPAPTVTITNDYTVGCMTYPSRTDDGIKGFNSHFVMDEPVDALMDRIIAVEAILKAKKPKAMEKDFHSTLWDVIQTRLVEADSQKVRKEVGAILYILRERLQRDRFDRSPSYSMWSPQLLQFIDQLEKHYKMQLTKANHAQSSFGISLGMTTPPEDAVSRLSAIFSIMRPQGLPKHASMELEFWTVLNAVVSKHDMIIEDMASIVGQLRSRLLVSAKSPWISPESLQVMFDIMRHIENTLTKDNAELSLQNWKKAQGEYQLCDLLQSDEVNLLSRCKEVQERILHYDWSDSNYPISSPEILMWHILVSKLKGANSLGSKRTDVVYFMMKQRERWATSLNVKMPLPETFYKLLDAAAKSSGMILEDDQNSMLIGNEPAAPSQTILEERLTEALRKPLLSPDMRSPCERNSSAEGLADDMEIEFWELILSLVTVLPEVSDAASFIKQTVLHFVAERLRWAIECGVVICPVALTLMTKTFELVEEVCH